VDAALDKLFSGGIWLGWGRRKKEKEGWRCGGAPGSAEVLRTAKHFWNKRNREKKKNAQGTDRKGGGGGDPVPTEIPPPRRSLLGWIFPAVVLDRRR